MVVVLNSSVAENGTKKTLNLTVVKISIMLAYGIFSSLYAKFWRLDFLSAPSCKTISNISVGIE